MALAGGQARERANLLANSLHHLKVFRPWLGVRKLISCSNLQVLTISQAKPSRRKIDLLF